MYLKGIQFKFTKGIITGYPDGTFKGGQGLTRAEASTVVVRVLEKGERKVPDKPSTDIPSESGPNVDLNKVTVGSKARVSIYPVNDPQNCDFSVLFDMFNDLGPQHRDAENLFTARFGKNNSSVKEIMDYIKKKDIREKELPLRTWYINGQQINVQSRSNGISIDLTVWRAN